jgi:hypothetical protein
MWQRLLAAAVASVCCLHAAADRSATAPCDGIGCLASQLENSWVASLSPDPAAAANPLQNKQTREVRSGHYVLVPPTPLPQPVLVATSREMAAELNLTEADLQQDSAVRLLGKYTSHALPCCC